MGVRVGDNAAQRIKSADAICGVSLCIPRYCRVGLAIDIQWHTDIGRDKLLTPPHMMIFSGIIPTLVFSLQVTFSGLVLCVKTKLADITSQYSRRQYRYGLSLQAWLLYSSVDYTMICGIQITVSIQQS